MESPARIPLARRDGTVLSYALVDARDFVWLSQWRWRLLVARSSHRYAIRFEELAAIYMHRELCGLPRRRPGGNRRGQPQVDHFDGDGLNNQRSNLRVTTSAGNHQNRHGGRGTSPYRGVCWDKSMRKWLAHAKLNGIGHNLGYFTDELEAARAASEWRAAHMPYSADAQRKAA